jgi:integrase
VKTGSEWSRDHLEDLVRQDIAAMALTHASLNRRLLGLRMLLDHLDTLPGTTWQERWDAADVNAAEDWMAPFRPGNNYQRSALNGAVHTIMGHAIIRPTYQWLLTIDHQASFKDQLRATTHRRDFEQLAAIASTSGVPRRMRELGIALLTRVVIHTGKQMNEITTVDLLAYADACRSSHVQAAGVQVAHQLLRNLGCIDDPPLLSRYGIRRSNRYTVEEMVDRHQVRNQPIRDLFVRYLKERETAVDYASLRNIANKLIGNFWSDIERHHPDVESIQLPPTIARAWQERLWTLPNGRARNDVHSILVIVRAFYLDIAHWAAESPDLWAPWVARPPISDGDLRPFHKIKLRHRARMHARTRTLMPFLPKLVSSAHQHLLDATELLAQAKTASPGAQFQALGKTYRRKPIPPRADLDDALAPVTVVCLDDADPKTINCRTLENDAFWRWAIIEVLRLTGIRLEELLELSHLSIRHYRMADGQLVVLLQIAPSKTDRERVLPVCPELAHALACIVARVRAGQTQVPLVARYDYLEHEFVDAQPLLFQRPNSGAPASMSRTTITRLLARAAAHANLRDVDGQQVRFTPHDFRRLFATDAVNGGLPVHIAAKLLGHLNLATTQGYVAVYPEQVIRQVQAHIARRRTYRPSEEYREPTNAEWTEFEQHFRKRKLALGDCYRPYGSECPHEHACVRCPMLRMDPEQLPRLIAIEQDTQRLLAEARDKGWEGEVSGLETTLLHIKDKKMQVDRIKATPDGHRQLLVLTPRPRTS